MSALRAFLRDHRRLAVLLLALALLVKALVPAGFMLASGARVLTVEICADPSGTRMTKQIVIPADGKSHQSPGDHAKADGACAFSGLHMAALGGADAALLTLALAFILLLGFAPQAPPLAAEPAYLRPPLRGPPLHA